MVNLKLVLGVSKKLNPRGIKCLYSNWLDGWKWDFGRHFIPISFPDFANLGWDLIQLDSQSNLGQECSGNIAKNRANAEKSCPKILNLADCV